MILGFRLIIIQVICEKICNPIIAKTKTVKEMAAVMTFRDFSMEKTIDYYENNADLFADSTIDVAFSDVQDRFLSLLPKNGYILDFGCGSGRDTKYFLSKGYTVDAADGSEKLCEIARKNTGIDVRHLLFSELDEDAKYDGIWACASILHLTKHEIHKLFEACYRDNLHSIWAGQELYRKGNSKEEFYGILEKNMQPVYDSARRQGYEVWNRNT